MVLQREQALRLERSVASLRSAQYRVLRSFGIDPRIAPVRIKLSRRDAYDLNKELDALQDGVEKEILEYLTMDQRRRVRDLLDREADIRRDQINSMRD